MKSNGQTLCCFCPCPLSLPTTVKKKEMDIEYFIAFFSYECLSINKNGLRSWQEGPWQHVS